MIRIIFGVFMILHGLVHLLYVGQSTRAFELQEGMVWPDGAWVFSRLLGHESTRGMASVLLIMAAAGFIIGGISALLNNAWWPLIIANIAVFSTISYLCLWDGQWQHLDDKGGVGILINLGAFALSFILG